MALADLVEQGVDAWVSRQIEANVMGDELRRKIEERYPDESPTTYYYAIERGYKLWEQGYEFGRLGPDVRPLAGDYERPLVGPHGTGLRYNYTVDVLFSEPGTALLTQRTVHLSEEESLTRGEVEARVRAMIEEAQGPGRADYDLAGLPVNAEIARMIFVSVGRGFP